MTDRLTVKMQNFKQPLVEQKFFQRYLLNSLSRKELKLYNYQFLQQQAEIVSSSKSIFIWIWSMCNKKFVCLVNTCCKTRLENQYHVISLVCAPLHTFVYIYLWYSSILDQSLLSHICESVIHTLFLFAFACFISGNSSHEKFRCAIAVCLNLL